MHFLTDPIVIDSRLEELGWTREEMLEVVAAMVSARRSCTDNNTPAGPGFRSWDDGTKRLREIGLPKGLLRSDEHQISCVIDAKRNLKFAVQNTDDGTGIEKVGPQPTRRKRAQTANIVNADQGSLLEALEGGNVVPFSQVARPGGYTWWYLCAYASDTEIRAELCCPTGFKHGRFEDYFERIVLIGPDDDDLVSVASNDDAEDGEFDIPVSRK